MDPEAFLNFAIWLAEHGEGEAARRSAASRAYYASYHQALVALEHLQGSQRNRSSHESVVKSVAGIEMSGAPFYAAQLRELRIERTAADYRLDESFDELRTSHAVTRARVFCEWAKQLTAGD